MGWKPLVKRNKIRKIVWWSFVQETNCLRQMNCSNITHVEDTPGGHLEIEGDTRLIIYLVKERFKSQIKDCRAHSPGINSDHYIVINECSLMFKKLGKRREKMNVNILNNED